MHQRNLIKICIFGMLLLGGAVSSAEVGVTAKEVVIGSHSIESGPAAPAIVDTKAMIGYFDKVNSEGGIHDRKIKFIHIDAQNIAAKAFDVTKRLVDEDKIFAMVGAMGPAHQAAYPYLLKKGVPDIGPHDLLTVYHKPFQKLIFPYYPSVYFEGIQLAKYAAQKFPKKRACFLTRDLALSEEFKNGVEEGLKEAKADLVVGMKKSIERTAAQANAEIIALKNDKCEIIFGELFGPVFAAAVNFAHAQSFKPQWIVWGSAAQQKVMDLMDKSAREGIISNVVYGINESFGVPGWKDYAAIATKAGIPVDNNGSASGYARAQIFVEALRRAGKDLTREKLITAMESLNGWTCPMCLAPLQYSATDHSPFNTVTITKFVKDSWVRADETK